MSLATRCTACDTVFRVVQDQLKVSEGWVRCGRCQKVFSALDGLFDLEPEPAESAAAGVVVDEPAAAPASVAETVAATPPPARQEASRVMPTSTAEAAPQTLPATLPATAPPLAPAVAPADPLPWAAAARPAFDEPLLRSFEAAEEPARASRPADFDETPASRVAARDRNDFADAQFSSALLAEAGIDGVDGVDAAPDAPLIDALPAAEAAPEFLRQAERDARWERPRAVWALGLLCGLLLLALAAQATFHYRDLLAAVAPPLRPALNTLCDAAGCRIEPLRRIDDIVIDSSTLTSAPNGDNTVRLALVLRNRGALTLAMPSIELTLTDPGGQMLARRALTPADFAASSATLPAASEQALQLVLSTGSRRASGYTVEPFYP